MLGVGGDNISEFFGSFFHFSGEEDASDGSDGFLGFIENSSFFTETMKEGKGGGNSGSGEVEMLGGFANV